jgi:outer membrane protein assembly factor BamB
LGWAGGKNRGSGGITTSGNSVISTAGGTVTALSQPTGSTQWEVNFPDEDNLWANTSAAVADRSVYVAVQGGNEFGYLYEIDLVSGKINGRVKFYNPIQCSPSVTDDHIYVKAS